MAFVCTQSYAPVSSLVNLGGASTPVRGNPTGQCMKQDMEYL